MILLTATIPQKTAGDIKTKVNFWLSINLGTLSINQGTCQVSWMYGIAQTSSSTHGFILFAKYFLFWNWHTIAWGFQFTVQNFPTNTTDVACWQITAHLRQLKKWFGQQFFCKLKAWLSEENNTRQPKEKLKYYISTYCEVQPNYKMKVYSKRICCFSFVDGRHKLPLFQTQASQNIMVCRYNHSFLWHCGKVLCKLSNLHLQHRWSSCWKQLIYDTT